jgi:hypothetical protein
MKRLIREARLIFVAFGLFLALFILTLMLPASSLAENVNGDFLLDLKVNGVDMFTSQSFSINPDETLVFDLKIHEVQHPIEMENMSVEIFFAGIPVSTISQALNQDVNPGETYQPEIQSVNARDYLSIWGVPVATGKYRAVLKLEYRSQAQTKTWVQSRDLEVPGNPMTTVAGVGAAIISGIALTAVASLFKSLAGYSLEKQALSGKKSLESRARGNISKSMAASVKKILVKDRCPNCNELIKHSFCPICHKSARELQKLYRRHVLELATAGTTLLASGEIESLEELPQKLGIKGSVATDVTSTILNRRLFEAKRVARSLLASAIMTGISSAIAAILWVTIGGLAALGTTPLVAILVLSFLIPCIISTALRRRMLRQFIASANTVVHPAPGQTSTKTAESS